jgi:hypothetical protein
VRWSDALAYGTLTHLIFRFLNIDLKDFNAFTGAIPIEIGSLTALTFLDFGG